MVKNEIAQRVYEYGFVVDEIILYLDTHPCDIEALEYYECMREKYQDAVMEYQETIGPLFMSEVDIQYGWNWVATPWPWEGGKC